MSLVAYGSSDESDSEGTAVVPESKPSGGLFSLLPAPKKSRSSTGGSDGPSRESKSNLWPRDSSTHDDPDPQQTQGSLLSSLPKPKKRTEPVRISVPQIQRQDVSMSPSTVHLEFLSSCTELKSNRIHAFLPNSQTRMMMNLRGRKCKLRYVSFRSTGSSFSNSVTPPHAVPPWFLCTSCRAQVSPPSCRSPETCQ